MFSFSTGFLSILLMTMVAGVLSMMIRGQEEEDAIFYVSIMALVLSTIISGLWVTGNPQLKIFTVEKIKSVFSLSEEEYVVPI